MLTLLLTLAAAWVSPLPGPLTTDRPFVAPAGPYGPGHRGVDLRAPAGTSVRSSGDGVVAYAGRLAGRGVVTVRHAGGLRTTYEPVLALVAAGDRVHAGDVLGTLEPDGHCAPRACLHWGALRGQTYLDPLTLLHPQVRLLPLGRGAGLGTATPDAGPVAAGGAPHRPAAIATVTGAAAVATGLAMALGRRS